MTHDFKTARHAFSDADDTGMAVESMQNIDKLAIIKALKLASAIQDGRYVVFEKRCHETGVSHMLVSDVWSELE